MSTESIGIGVRITHCTEALATELVLRYAPECYLFARELQETQNDHYQFYLKVDCQAQTVRKWLKPRLPSKGNGQYSIKTFVESEPVEAISYLLKEGSIQYKLPPDLKERVWAFQEKYKAEVKAKKESRRTQLEIISENIEKELVFDGHSWHKPGSQQAISKGYIADHVIIYYRTSGILIRKFQLVSLCQTLYLKYGSGYEVALRQFLVNELTL